MSERREGTSSHSLHTMYTHLNMMCLMQIRMAGDEGALQTNAKRRDEEAEGGEQTSQSEAAS